MSSEEPFKKKKRRDVRLQLKTDFLDESFMNSVKECFKTEFKANTPLSLSTFDSCTHNGRADKHPFFHCMLPDFIDNDDFLENLVQELKQLDFHEKNNDLYKFHQSGDLKHVHSPCITQLCKFLQTDVRDWLGKITEIPLTDNVDVFCSQYEYTDILLCHDDELEKRRIAYIYYLVPPCWSEEDGGALDLFTSDDLIQPVDVVKSITPKRNNFLFFEVTERSFHQVAEVISRDKIRLAVSGWFHGPALPRQKPVDEPLPILKPYITVDEDRFYSWINPLYLMPEVQGEISEKFESESEIQLSDFLQKGKLEEVIKALKESDVPWSCIGPANKRKYYLCSKENYPKIVEECVEFLQSDAMFLVLSNITGLKLHELAPESDDEESNNASGNSEGPTSNMEGSASSSDPPVASQSEDSSVNDGKSVNSSCYSQVRQWKPGCYTLAHDTDSNQTSDFALDAVLYLACSDWKTEYGGYTSYIAKDEDDELLSVSPENNCLALVYRDKNSLRFVKHINHQATQLNQPYFYDISTVYYE